jgi:23S rRNA pseudouridine2605 synthase/23S rRNA pseudouridine2604 synthase
MAGIEEQQIRLNKYISKSGLYSRRQADKLIENGRVTVNGSKLFEVYEKVNPSIDLVCVDGKKLDISVSIYLKFYKPAFVLTSYVSQGCKKNLTFFEPFNKLRLPYSGRLDYDSEGLIIFCNDGDLISKLQLPSQQVQKEYIVITSGSLVGKQLRMLEEGIIYDNIRYKPCKIFSIGYNKYKVILYEGKKRQIRNMFKSLGVEIHKLVRVSIGPVKLGSLKPGDYKELTEAEIRGLKNV